MSDFQNRPPRPKFDVSSLGLTCANCGVEIKELPFEPTQKEDGTYGKLYCQQCNRERMKNRPRRFGSGGFGGPRRDRY